MLIHESLRNFVVHGWAFRDHTKEEVAAIRLFLKDGDSTHLPSCYLKVAEVATTMPAKGKGR